MEEVVRQAVTEALQKAMAAGAVPVSAVSQEGEQKLIEHAVEELPEVTAELRQSNRPLPLLTSNLFWPLVRSNGLALRPNRSST